MDVIALFNNSKRKKINTINIKQYYEIENIIDDIILKYKYLLL